MSSIIKTAFFSFFVSILLTDFTLSDTTDKAHAAPSLLLWLPLDEGRGNFTADLSSNMLEADLSNVRWATGPSGTAAHFNGTNSYIEIQAIPGLNGATQFTLSVWSQWDDAEPRRYPNLLTSLNWSPGGMMLFVSDGTCSFRLGRPGHRAGTPGHEWKETGVALLNKLPQNMWTHLCVTFAMPELTAYVNGELVGRGSWPYPLEVDALRLGGWHNPVCHRGLLDDLRIYSRALSDTEVKTLAEDSKRDAQAYALVDETAIEHEIAARFANRHAELVIGTDGQVLSLRSKKSKRELLSSAQPMVSALLADGRRISARSVIRKGKTLEFGFSRGKGTCTLEVNARRDFFEFTVTDLTLADVESLTFCALPMALKKYRGEMANMISDDTDAVCLRGYDLPLEMSASEYLLRVWSTADHGLTGWRAGLAAGEKKAMTGMLRAMTRQSKVPYSKLGGAWSLGAEANRGSYLFADLTYASTDDWIDVARRGGFSTIHLHGWWQSLGHYGVRTNYYPRGVADMKDTVDRIHAAGMRAGIHTLTACISTSDPWIKSDANSHLIPFDSYTLARALAPTDTVLVVNEMPSSRHDVVFTYSGRGNAIRIGTEIIQYTAVSRDPPYAFSNCKRGAFGTLASAHAVDAQADYLQQRYMAFYPQPDSPLANELAARIADVYNTCGLDQLYFDGSEGMMSRYGIDAMRHKIFRLLQGDPLVEASCHGKHNWWFHSRLGAWDHPVWGAKRFQDRHIATSALYRDTDLLEPQMGWWAPRHPSAQARGHFLDEMEYFACKNLGLDSAMSIQGINVSRNPLPYHIERQFTLMGWYECLRLARYFNAATIERVAVPGDDFRLRQDRDGMWRFTPVNMMERRVNASGNGSDSWTVRNPYAVQPLCARIEALYSAEPYQQNSGAALIGEADFANLKVSTASSSVKLKLSEEKTETKGGQINLRMSAENTGHTNTGAWARAVLNFPEPYRDLNGKGAFGLWVKGDGSGALLNIQAATPREYMHALSDHYVTLDFTGWRYVELLVRERDVDRMNDYVWPYGGSYTIYRTPLNMRHISQATIYLNDLPPGRKVDITVSPVMAVATKKTTLNNPGLTLNGQTFTLPFKLASGDFAEIGPDGSCTHYDEHGFPLSRVNIDKADLPVLRPETNALRFTCEKTGPLSARVAVTVCALGSPFGKTNPRRKIGWRHLDREYEMTRLFNSENDLRHGRWSVAVRPGEKARLELELCGDMDAPLLTIGQHEVRFHVTLKTNERLVCRDGKNWQVYGADRSKLSAGSLDTELPLLRGGATEVSFTCKAPDKAQVKLTKVYR